jgi:hypothetical protein
MIIRCLHIHLNTNLYEFFVLQIYEFIFQKVINTLKSYRQKKSLPRTGEPFK